MAVLAIEMSDDEARCLWFDPRRGAGIKVLTETGFDQIPIPSGVIRQGVIQDVSGLVVLLQKARLQRKAKPGTRVLLALPWALGIIRTHGLPWFPQSQRVQALHYLIEEDMPIPEGNIAYDFRVLAEKRDDFLEVLAGAVRRTTLDGYVSAFQQAGFRLERVDLAPTSLAALLPLEKEEDALCLYPEGERLNLTIFHGSTLKLVRTLSGGAEGQIRTEFERMLLYVTAQLPEFRLRRVWCLGASSQYLAGILDHLDPAVTRESVPQVVEKAEAAFKFAPSAVAMAGQYLNKQQGLNLWPLAQLNRRKTRKKLGLGFALLASLTIGLLVWYPLSREVEALERETVRLRAEGSKHLEEKNLERALLSRWNEIQKTSPKTGALLQQVEEKSAQGVVLESLEFKQGLLYLRASAQEAKEIEWMMKELTKLGWEKPVLVSYAQESKGDIHFALTARRSSSKSPKLP